MLAGIFDVTPFCLYDSVQLSAGSRCELFQRPLGVDNADLVYTESGWFTRWLRTNMFESGRLSNPQEFVVKRLNVLFLRAGRPLRLFETDLYGKTAIDFRVNAKSYWQSPAWQCASPFAIFETPVEELAGLKAKYGLDWQHVGANFTRSANDRDPQPYRHGFPNVWEETTGLLLMCQEPFIVSADVAGDVEQGLELVAHLDGVIARPVQ